MIHAVPERVATGWINYRIFMSPVVYTVFINVSFHNKTIVVTCLVNTCIVYNSPTIYVYVSRTLIVSMCVHCKVCVLFILLYFKIDTFDMFFINVFYIEYDALFYQYVPLFSFI